MQIINTGNTKVAVTETPIRNSGNAKVAAKEIQIRNTKIAAKININNRYRQYKSGCYYCLSRLSHSLTEDQSEQCASSPS